MCVPCVTAAAPTIGPLLLLFLILIAGLLYGIGKMIPPIGLMLGLIAVGTWRFVTGAPMDKAIRQSDADYWDMMRAKGHRGPLVTRGVRATGRLLTVATVIGFLMSPVIAAITVGTLSLTIGGGAAYARRDRIRATTRRAVSSTRKALSR